MDGIHGKFMTFKLLYCRTAVRKADEEGGRVEKVARMEVDLLKFIGFKLLAGGSSKVYKV